MKSIATTVVAVGMPTKLKPSEDGLIHPHSRYAIVHGEMLRFEPQSHKDTVGYWVNEWTGPSGNVSLRSLVGMRLNCDMVAEPTRAEVT